MLFSMHEGLVSLDISTLPSLSLLAVYISHELNIFEKEKRVLQLE
jgi:hypothetical protein